MGSSSGLVSPNARGHRARGLQRRRRRLAVFSVRSRALARLPLERGRLGGPHRSRAASLFRSPFWNGRDPILKQRIFGLSGPEGNHGEDPKELLVVSRSDADLLLAALALSLSQAEFPYERLRQENAKRTREQPEFKLLDSGAFDGDRYWQITAEYAKAASDGSHHRSQHGARARRAPLVPQPMAFPNLSFVTCPTRRPRW
jgi:hypothetical protein